MKHRTLPAQITAAREAAGLTPTELARKIGQLPPFVFNVEAGRRRPNLDHLERMSAALGVRWDIGPGSWPSDG